MYHRKGKRLWMSIIPIKGLTFHHVGIRGRDREGEGGCSTSHNIIALDRAKWMGEETERGNFSVYTITHTNKHSYSFNTCTPVLSELLRMQPTDNNQWTQTDCPTNQYVCTIYYILFAFFFPPYDSLIEFCTGDSMATMVLVKWGEEWNDKKRQTAAETKNISNLFPLLPVTILILREKANELQDSPKVSQQLHTVRHLTRLIIIWENVFTEKWSPTQFSFTKLLRWEIVYRCSTVCGNFTINKWAFTYMKEKENTQTFFCLSQQNRHGKTWFPFIYLFSCYFLSIVGCLTLSARCIHFSLFDSFSLFHSM